MISGECVKDGKSTREAAAADADGPASRPSRLRVTGTAKRYFFLPATGKGARLDPDTGTGTAFFGCIGFLVSLLPRS